MRQALPGCIQRPGWRCFGRRSRRSPRCWTAGRLADDTSAVAILTKVSCHKNTKTQPPQEHENAASRADSAARHQHGRGAALGRRGRIGAHICHFRCCRRRRLPSLGRWLPRCVRAGAAGHRRGRTPSLTAELLRGRPRQPPRALRAADHRGRRYARSPPVDPHRKVMQRCLTRSGISDHHDDVAGVASLHHRGSDPGAGLVVGRTAHYPLATVKAAGSASEAACASAGTRALGGGERRLRLKHSMRLPPTAACATPVRAGWRLEQTSIGSAPTASRSPPPPNTNTAW